MPGMRAQALITKLVRLVGPTARGVIGASGQVDTIAGLLAAFAEQLNEAEVTKLVNEIMGFVEVYLPDDKGVMPLSKIFDMHFHGGNLSEMYKVIGAFLEVNYSDFFGGEASAGELKDLAVTWLKNARASHPQSTSGGKPGA